MTLEPYHEIYTLLTRLSFSQSMAHLCASCDEPADKKCAGCGKVWYCSKQCQNSHWSHHLFNCKRPEDITTGDRLVRAAIRDEIPTDPQTLEDYGFRRASTNALNQSYLLGLYRWLAALHPMSPVRGREFHRWRTSGTLIQEIKLRYEALPSDNRGQYYPWFLANQWVLDGRHVTDDELAEGYFRTAWLYSGGSPSASLSVIKRTAATWSQEKNQCFQLCVPVVSGFSPPTHSDAWIPFGFCACEGENGMSWLGGFYRSLLEKCTFQEFLGAFESESLLELIDLKGMGQDIPQFGPYTAPCLLEFLGGSCSNFSVWSLKQLVAADKEGFSIPIGRATRYDYGFLNCKTSGEEDELKKAYGEFFDAKRGSYSGDYSSGPLALHYACIKGNIFEHISGFIKLKNPKRMRRLMKNAYPLAEI